MSSKIPPPPRTKSGTNPAVVAHRKKLESLANLEDELKSIADSARPPKDPRREDDEPVPDDKVNLEKEEKE